MAKGADWANPFTPAEAPVKAIAPRCRGSMRRAACWATRNAPNAETSSDCRTASGSRSAIGPRTRAEAL